MTLNQFDLPPPAHPTFIFENFWLLAFLDPSELQLEESQSSEVQLEGEILTLIRERCHLKGAKGEYTHAFTCNYTLIASCRHFQNTYKAPPPSSLIRVGLKRGSELVLKKKQADALQICHIKQVNGGEVTQPGCLAAASVCNGGRGGLGVGGRG